ncbi:MAG: GNAT family N-acetyltransferase [Caldisericia bacterium]|nr:GNAT family N-acetyltransferase [Caldisericia bacterium]
MIIQLSQDTDINTLKEITRIHKECIKQINSQYYSNKQIKEWDSLINIKNIEDQLKNTIWIVIKENNKIIGFGQYSLKDKEIYQIQVDPGMQRKGYGRKIYEYIEEDFKRNNINEITLLSTLNAIAFYKSLGFNIVKHIYFKLKTEEIEMVKMRKI